MIESTPRLLFIKIGLYNFMHAHECILGFCGLQLLLEVAAFNAMENDAKYYLLLLQLGYHER